MIRKPKVIDQCCPTCHRPGWVFEERYTLQTKEEYIAEALRLWPDDLEEHRYRRERADQVFAPPPGTPPDTLFTRITGGGIFSEGVAEALQLAGDLDCPVMFFFNGVPVTVHKFSDPTNVWVEYRKRLNPNFNPETDW